MADSETVEILLVEDNPADAELTPHARRNSKLANQIQLVRDGEEALDFLFCREAFLHRRFDVPPRLVLLDLKLPRVDGLQVLQALKSDPRTQAIPVIVLTSSKEERDLVSSYKFGPPPRGDSVQLRQAWRDSARRQLDCVPHRWTTGEYVF